MHNLALHLLLASKQDQCGTHILSGDDVEQRCRGVVKLLLLLLLSGVEDYGLVGMTGLPAENSYLSEGRGRGSLSS